MYLNINENLDVLVTDSFQNVIEYKNDIWYRIPDFDDNEICQFIIENGLFTLCKIVSTAEYTESTTFKSIQKLAIKHGYKMDYDMSFSGRKNLPKHIRKYSFWTVSSLIHMNDSVEIARKIMAMFPIIIPAKIFTDLENDYSAVKQWQKQMFGF